jgi:glycosyltransferase involved in cell wall biosynthesis
MLSHNKALFLESSIKSIITQTYKNWELIFLDDASSDDSLNRIMDLRDGEHQFKISHCVFSRGESVNRNSALKDVRGRWITFLNAGDIWEPTKLEKQVRFMKENDYAFSYTMFNNIDAQGKNIGVRMSGPECITKDDMKKCCWMGYLTVMYDAEKIGCLQVNGVKRTNDYPLWLLVSRKADCHLLPECLASQMSEKGLKKRLLSSPKWLWRYETYREIERMNPIPAAYMTIRNLAYTAYKWWKYAKRS